MSAVTECRYRAAKARQHVVRMVRSSGAGHMGGALSCIDMVTALYFHTMRLPAHDGPWPDAATYLREADPGRDRFVLSAGHKCMAQYAVLAEAGYFPLEVLDTYGKLGTKIPGHPDMWKLPGIEANTGALGHGTAISLGMALGLRGTDARVFTILGDGELPEGSNWEAFAAAAHHRAGNLVAIIDVNGLQISGPVTEVMNMEPIAAKLEAFGWQVWEVDGNDMAAVIELFDALPVGTEKPQAIIARTVKSKGLSFAEGRVEYHYWKPKPEQLAQAEAETQAAVSEAEVQR